MRPVPGMIASSAPGGGREQQGHAERQVTVRAEVGDAGLLAVFQDEYQREDQDYGGQGQPGPHPAQSGAPDHMCRAAGAAGRGYFRRGGSLRVVPGPGGMSAGVVIVGCSPSAASACRCTWRMPRAT